VLSSGSKANCTFLEAGGVRVLIDCGLSGRQAELRLAEIGVDPATLTAIFVTHEHHDHIQGVAALSRRFNLPVYANAATFEQLGSLRRREVFSTGRDFTVGGLSCTPFSITHDAVEPVGFTVRAEGLTFVHVTDLGRVTTLVREQLRGAHAVVLESNHDVELLQACSYPWELKQRISSSHGHLSNQGASELLEEVLHPELFHIVLAHLSENSNTAALALHSTQAVVRRCAERATHLQTVVCGSVYQSLPVLELDARPSVEVRCAVRCGAAPLDYPEPAHEDVPGLAVAAGYFEGVG
jgi:phosphoribosyl 1,2-cyclic phosphodiesterase